MRASNTARATSVMIVTFSLCAAVGCLLCAAAGALTLLVACLVFRAPDLAAFLLAIITMGSACLLTLEFCTVK